MNAVLFFVGLLVVSSIVGAITNWLRNQKAAEQERQERLANARPLANRGRGDEPPTVPPVSRGRPVEESTPAEVLNRYAAEVEKLRKRKAGAPPVVVPVAKKRAPDAPHSRVSSSPPPPPAPSAYQVTRAPQSQRQTGSLVAPRAEDLPVAPLIQPGAPLPAQPKADFSATSAPPGVRGGQSSTLEAFFRSPKNLAAAMMLSEILSKPKAYQNGSQKPSRPRDMDAGREPPEAPPAESNGHG